VDPSTPLTGIENAPHCGMRSSKSYLIVHIKGAAVHARGGHIYHPDTFYTFDALGYTDYQAFEGALCI
jgi:hypothetical protein